MCLALAYTILAKHVALSPVGRVSLRQLVLLNEFGTYLNPHPAHPWWKIGWPYPFESQILYRGTTMALLFLLFFPRLIVSWSELLVSISALLMSVLFLVCVYADLRVI